MKKKILALSLCVALLAVAVVGGTLAYFTDTTETKENVFTVGNVDIDLTEPNWDEFGSKDADDVYPGEALKKDPTVTNVGANPCFVRVKVTGLDSLVENYGENAVIIYRDKDWNDNMLNAGWEDGDDGYFYWTKPLEKDTETAPVFSYIVMPTALENDILVQKVDEDGNLVVDDEGNPVMEQPEYSVDVVAEAVQAQGAFGKNWAGVKGMTVAGDQGIAAWFKECGMNEVTGGDDNQQ